MEGRGQCSAGDQAFCLFLVQGGGGCGGGGGGGGEGESPLSSSGAAQAAAVAAAGAEKEEGKEDRGRWGRRRGPRGNGLQRNTIRASRHVCQAFLLCAPTYNHAENVPESQSCSVTYI